MAQVLVRNLDEEVVASLKDRARLRGQPLEAFLRGVLGEAARLTGPEKAALVEAHMARFAPWPPNEDWEARYIEARDERDRRGEDWGTAAPDAVPADAAPAGAEPAEAYPAGGAAPTRRRA